jgi:hypothetical protein
MARYGANFRAVFFAATHRAGVRIMESDITLGEKL